jgi:hypothetical protein
LDYIFAGEFDELAQVRRTLGFVPGVLAGYNSNDEDVHIKAATLHSIKRQKYHFN